MAKVSEKQLEDWIVEHWDDTYIGGELIGRQLVLPHGRLDLLSVGHIPEVIELKAERLKEKHVGQLLRYVGDIKGILSAFYYNTWDDLKTSLDTEYEQKEAKDIFCNMFDGISTRAIFEDGLEPILIGKSIDAHLLCCAHGAGITVYTWEYNEDTQGFTFKHPCGPHDVQDRIRKWLYANWERDWVLDFVSETWHVVKHHTLTIENGFLSNLFGTKCSTRYGS